MPRLASVEFDPWQLADMCIVPTTEQWMDDANEALGFLRLASHLVSLDKAAFVRDAAELPARELDALLQALPKWAYRFRTLEALAETAHTRLMVAVAILAQGDGESQRARPPKGAERRGKAGREGSR